MQPTKNMLIKVFIYVDNQIYPLRRIKEMKALLLDKIVPLLLILGGLTLGLTQVFDFNPVTKVFGTGTTVTGVVYIIVGVAALLSLYHFIDDTMHHGTTD